LKDVIKKQLINKWTSFINNENVILLTYPTISTRVLFDKYFSEHPPFKGQGKKSEFPDAVSLITLEQWCLKNRQVCYTFTDDHSWIGYNDDLIKIIKDHREFVEILLKKFKNKKYESSRFDLASNVIEKYHESIIENLNTWLEEQFDSESTYNLDLHISLYNVDIHEIDTKLYRHTIISISDINILVECEAISRYRISIEIDDEDEGYFDNEDSKWHMFETKKINLENSINFSVELEIDIPIAGESFAQATVTRINQDRDIHIEI
jgi:hypothetical protein